MAVLASFTVDSHSCFAIRDFAAAHSALCSGHLSCHSFCSPHAGDDNLLRTLLAIACLILGSVLLIPMSLWLWRYPASGLAAQEIHYLPESHTDFILSLGGRMIDSA